MSDPSECHDWSCLISGRGVGSCWTQTSQWLLHTLGKFDLLFPDPKYKRLIFSISFIPRHYDLGFTS